MRISHDHKFVFLSLPRSASLSIRRFLDPYSDIKSIKLADVTESSPFWHHTKAKRAQEIFSERGWKWSAYKTFCLVRNPYDRLVSAYKKRWEKNYGVHVTGNYISDLKSIVRDAFLKRPSFESYVHQNDPRKGYSISIEEFAHDGCGQMLVDNVLKFENLPKNVIKYAETELGLEVSKRRLKHLHKSNRKVEYKKWYNEKTKQILQKKYKMEINKFEYEF